MENLQELKPVGKLSPFAHFCCTIGNLPTSYMISLTYEEQLLWLCNYLEKTVIPAVNTNAEAVAELQNLYIQLKEYVDNYFTNLDIQTEINNKLDEMAENGQLADIIAQYIQLRGLLCYNSVQDMKNATNLVNGSFAKTYGFYNYNDDGGAFYKIRQITNTDVIDEITIIALHDNSLIAELIINETMNAKQFGAKGDNIQDDTVYIQKSLNNCKNVIINNGNFKINVDTKLIPLSNQTINLINANLIALPSNNGTTSQNFTALFYINNKENITFNGNYSKLIGERLNHEGTSHQHGFGIDITNSSKNIVIKNLILKDFTGDAIILDNGSNENITIDNIICDNNHRQGISLCGCNNVLINNSQFINSKGTNPQTGIDIEPYGTQYCKNITITNCKFSGNTNEGLLISNLGVSLDPIVYYIDNIKITNCDFNNNGTFGLNAICVKNLSILNCKFYENTYNGLRIASNSINSSIKNSVFNNNLTSGITIVYCDNLSIINNTIYDNTYQGIITNAINNSLLSNNLIYNNGLSGIELYNDTDKYSKFNTLISNKLFNNSSMSAGTRSNIEFDDRSTNNVITNNDFNTSSSTTKYDIEMVSPSATDNLISFNNCITGHSGSIYSRSCPTLHNIIDRSYARGSLDTQ